jgi:DNA-binding NtrC family response regulator
MTTTVLIVDDEEFIRTALRDTLSREGYATLEAATASEALEQFDAADVVLLDYCLPDMDGLDVLDRMKAARPDTPVILLTGMSSVQTAVTAMKRGAYHYVTKPADFDEVVLLLKKALEERAMRTRLTRIASHEREQHGVRRLAGESPVIQELRQTIVRVAATPHTTVLITGESGTGKDLVARAIHAESERAAGLFVHVACSALTEERMELELFGYEAGAVPEAHTAKQGVLEQADGGTLLFDQVGDLPAALQGKLLRFLGDKAFRRVGSATDTFADVRVIASSQRDLAAAVRDGTFRDELFYRLAVVHIQMPPLRERKQDIGALVAQCVERHARELGRPVTGVSPEAMRLLESHSWPGNVRELSNTVERAVLSAAGSVLGVDDFSFIGPKKVRRDGAPGRFELPSEGIDFREFERDLIVQALRLSGGNQTRAAHLLGMTRDQIRYRMAKFGLDETRVSHVS